MKSQLIDIIRFVCVRVLGPRRVRRLVEGLSSAANEVTAGRARLYAWRRQRPFSGGAVLLLSAVVIGYMPFMIAIQTLTLGTSRSALGLLCAVLIAISGIAALTRPSHSTFFGVVGSALSILSLLGTFGGLLIGTLVGCVGGSLCVAWTDSNLGTTEEVAS